MFDLYLLDIFRNLWFAESCHKFFFYVLKHKRANTIEREREKRKVLTFFKKIGSIEIVFSRLL